MKGGAACTPDSPVMECLMIRLGVAGLLMLVVGACTTAEKRIGGAAAGAGAGALVAGPVGAVVGGAAGAMSAPAVARGTRRAMR